VHEVKEAGGEEAFVQNGPKATDSGEAAAASLLDTLHHDDDE